MANLIKAVSGKMPKQPKLLIEERRRKILDMVNSQGGSQSSDLRGVQHFRGDDSR